MLVESKVSQTTLFHPFPFLNCNLSAASADYRSLAKCWERAHSAQSRCVVGWGCSLLGDDNIFSNMVLIASHSLVDLLLTYIILCGVVFLMACSMGDRSSKVPPASAPAGPSMPSRWACLPACCLSCDTPRPSD